MARTRRVASRVAPRTTKRTWGDCTTLSCSVEGVATSMSRSSSRSTTPLAQTSMRRCKSDVPGGVPCGRGGSKSSARNASGRGRGGLGQREGGSGERDIGQAARPRAAPSGEDAAQTRVCTVAYPRRFGRPAMGQGGRQVPCPVGPPPRQPRRRANRGAGLSEGSHARRPRAQAPPEAKGRAKRRLSPVPRAASHVLGIGTLRALRSALPRTTKPQERTKKKPRAEKAEGAPTTCPHVRQGARQGARGACRERRGGRGRRRSLGRRRRRRRRSGRRRGLPRGRGRRRRPVPHGKAREPGEASSIERFDPLSAYLREVQRHPLLSPEETQALAEKFVKTQDSAAAAQARDLEPPARGQDRVRVPPRLQEHHGPHPGGEHRPDAGRQALRPVSRREALVVRRLVDPRVHPAVHPEQLAPREARNDAGAAQALLQPAKEARGARGARDRPDQRRDRQAAQRAGERGRRDGRAPAVEREVARRADGRRRGPSHGEGRHDAEPRSRARSR